MARRGRLVCRCRRRPKSRPSSPRRASASSPPTVSPKTTRAHLPDRSELDAVAAASDHNPGQHAPFIWSVCAGRVGQCHCSALHRTSRCNAGKSRSIDRHATPVAPAGRRRRADPQRAARDRARANAAKPRARRVSAIAIPDPTLTAAFDQATSPFAFGAPSRPVGLGLSIPFPDKFRLNNRIGQADIGTSESNYRLQQQTVALAASATYDSLLVALKHRRESARTRKRSRGFSQADAGALRGRNGRQARRHSGAGQRSRSPQRSDRQRARPAERRRPRSTERSDASSARRSSPTDSLDAAARAPRLGDDRADRAGESPELAILQQQQAGASARTSLVKEFWLPDLVVRRRARLRRARDRRSSRPESRCRCPRSTGSTRAATSRRRSTSRRELDATYRDTRAQVTQDVRVRVRQREHGDAAGRSSCATSSFRRRAKPIASRPPATASAARPRSKCSPLERALLQAQSQLADALAAANTARADLDRALGAPVTAYGASIR